MKYILGLIVVFLFLGSCSSDTSNSTTNLDAETSTEIPREISTDTSDIDANVTSKNVPARLGTAPVRIASQVKLDKMHKNLMKQMETGFAAKDVVTYAKEAELYMSIYGDSLAAEHLFNAGELYRAVGDYTKALETWYVVYRSYDQDGHPKAPHAMFQCGFTYDSILDKKDLAKTLYQMFLKRYPDHALAKDAKLLLANLDKSPEDLIKEFQKKNKQ